MAKKIIVKSEIITEDKILKGDGYYYVYIRNGGTAKATAFSALSILASGAYSLPSYTHDGFYTDMPIVFTNTGGQTQLLEVIRLYSVEE